MDLGERIRVEDPADDSMHVVGLLRRIGDERVEHLTADRRRVPMIPAYGIGMLYLVLVGIPMQVVAALITLSDRVLYPWYSAAPRTWGLSPLDDQQFGGLLMWVPGNLWMFLAIGVLFLKWAKETE
jgi:hypothetical protein